MQPDLKPKQNPGGRIYWLVNAALVVNLAVYFAFVFYLYNISKWSNCSSEYWWDMCIGKTFISAVFYGIDLAVFIPGMFPGLYIYFFGYLGCLAYSKAYKSDFRKSFGFLLGLFIFSVAIFFLEIYYITTFGDDL